MTRIATVVLTLWAGTAFAQGAPIDTPSGAAVIAGERGAPAPSVGGRAIDIGDEWMSAAFERQVGALILLALRSGGDACGTPHAWLDTRPDRLGLTETFGPCAMAAEVSWEDETVTMPSREGGDVAFVYHGRAATREVALGRQAPRSPPGADPLAWVGAAPADLLRAPDWEAALVALMGADALEEARTRGDVSSGMVREGDWIVGRGCQPHDCDLRRAAVAIAVPDRRLLAALRTKDGAPRPWGDPRGPLPPSLLAHLAGG